MDLGRIAIFSVLLPFVIALVGLAGLKRFCRQFWQQGIGFGLILIAVLLCCYTAAMSWISFPFRDANQVLLVMVPSACALLSIGIRGEPNQGAPRPLRFFLLFVVIGALFAWLLRAPIENEWSGTQTLVTLLVTAGLPAAFAGFSADRAKQGPTFPSLFISGASLGLIAAAQGGSGSVLLAEMAGAGALFGLALLLLANGFDKALLNLWALLALAILLPGFLLLGTFYASMPQLAAGLFAVGAGLAWVVAHRLEAITMALPKRIFLLVIVLVIAMAPGLGVVGYDNWQKMQQASSSDYEY